jgi:hypothetical protein
MTHHAPIPLAAPPDDDASEALADADPRPGERWTPPKMAAFLRMLAATHSVKAAARSVGMSRQSAYRLRSRMKGGAFDLAWDVAFQHSYDNLAHAALERALNGVEIPVFCNGEQVGSYRKYDERLTIALLAMSTHTGVPTLGRRNAEAELHAGRFEALVGEIEAASDVDDGAAPHDPGRARQGEIARLLSRDLSPRSDAEIIAQLRGVGRRKRG